jgi:hypothetical protein
VWCNGAFLPPSTRVFWADGPLLHEIRTGHKTRPTNHAQTREIRLQPDPRRQQQQRHTSHSLTELASTPFCSSQWGQLWCCLLPASWLAARFDAAGRWGPSGKPRCMGPRAWGRWGRMGPHRAAPGRMVPGMGPVQKIKINSPGKKEKKARGRLLFAALALGQQPTGTAIKVPHPC